MKNFLSLCMVIMVFMMFTSVSFAASGEEKLKGGVQKFFTSPLQVKENVVSEYNAAEFKPFGVVGGLLKGIFYAGKQAITGVIDVLTFPVDCSKCSSS